MFINILIKQGEVMKSAIEKLYFGETAQEGFEMTKEWKRLNEKCKEVFDEFYKSLNEEQKKQYEQIFDYESVQASEELRQAYGKGFKLGLALAAESFLVDD